MENYELNTLITSNDITKLNYIIKTIGDNLEGNCLFFL